MLYLAVQMSLYLVSAALIGIGLGWLFWGHSRNRKLTKLHSEMTASLEAERSFSDEARRDLANADAKLNQAIEFETASSAKAITEIRQLLETEKKATFAARAEKDQLRLDMDIAISAEKATAADAIREANLNAEGIETALNEARARETQVRAELEELRLMAGAEKLAAQSARSEFDLKQNEIQASLDTERSISKQARTALDEIRATLARTFGDNDGIIATSNNTPETSASETRDLFRQNIADVEEIGDDAPSHADEEFDDILRPAAFNDPIAVPGVNVEPGTAFNIQDDMVTVFDEPEFDEVLTDHMDIQSSEDNLEVSDLYDDDQHDSEPEIDVVNQTVQLRQPLELEEQETTPKAVTRPRSFFDERPEDVDSLQAIGGIDSELEQLLNDHGCYQFKQLIHISGEDIDWLSRTFENVPDLRERIERDGWVVQARELQAQKDLATNAERPRWWNRRRLQ